MRKDNLDGSQNDTRVAVLKLRRNSFTDMLRLLDVHRRVVGQRRQDGDAAPLGALVERHEQLLEHRARDDQRLGLGRRLADLGQGLHRVGHDGRVGVANHLLQRLEEAVFDAHGRVEVEELGHADGGGLAHVRRFVAQCLAERFFHVVDHLVYADAAHRSYGEGSYEWVGVFGVLDKSVDGEDTKVGMRFCVIPVA